MSENQLVGAWTEFRDLNAEDQKVFKTALEGHVGVKYTALLVATQVVNGTNYCFDSTGEITNATKTKIAALVYALKATDGHISLSEIKRIRP